MLLLGIFRWPGDEEFSASNRLNSSSLIWQAVRREGCSKISHLQLSIIECYTLIEVSERKHKDDILTAVLRSVSRATMWYYWVLSTKWAIKGSKKCLRTGSCSRVFVRTMIVFDGTLLPHKRIHKDHPIMPRKIGLTSSRSVENGVEVHNRRESDISNAHYILIVGW